MFIDNVDVQSIVKEIIVSKDRIEIFCKNLLITSCYLDSKIEKLHFKTLNDWGVRQFLQNFSVVEIKIVIFLRN